MWRPGRDDRSVPRTVFESAAGQAGFELTLGQDLAVDALIDHSQDLYLWGPPGRGKSWLMDVYVSHLPAGSVQRWHFHEFFAALHRDIRRHRGNLETAIASMIGKAQTVCFDEFHVHDPADGIFLARLLRALFDGRTRLVVTSNYAPTALMPNPLFHDMFVPTIDLITGHMRVVGLDDGVDHRTNNGSVPGSEFADGRWVHIDPQRPDPTSTTRILVANRPMAVTISQGTLRIGFDELCRAPTAPSDYLELALAHRDWIIDRVPHLDDAEPQAAQRFSNVIDVLYDRDVRTVIHALVSWEEFSSGTTHSHDADRLISRLAELARRSTP